MRKYLFVLILGQFAVASTNAQDVYTHWIKTFQGHSFMFCRDMAINSNGDVYTTGTFRDTVDFDPNSGVAEVISPDPMYGDCFVAKLDASGNYAKAWGFGGFGAQDFGAGIVAGPDNNVYTTGYFHTTADFDPGSDPSDTFNLTSAGQSDMFVCRTNENDQLVWARRLGSGQTETNNAIALDANGNIYTTGIYFNDFYLYKSNPLGDTLWTRRFPATNNVAPGFDVATDAAGNVYVTGYFWGLSFLPNAGSEDVFIFKFDTEGSLLWSRSFGGTAREFGNAIAVDASNNIYVSGLFTGHVDFNPSIAPADTFFQTAAGGRDGYVLKLDEEGEFVWAVRCGGTAADNAGSLTLDNNNNIYLSGTFSLEAAFGETTLTSAGGTDIYMAKLNSDGLFTWAKRIGGPLDDSQGTIQVDNSGNIFLSGIFFETADLDPEAGVMEFTSAGGSDMFVMKLSQEPLAVSNAAHRNTVRVFPNPATDQLYISCDPGFNDFSVFDMSGRIVMQTSLKSQNDVVSLQTVSPGTYVYRLTNKSTGESVNGRQSIIHN